MEQINTEKYHRIQVGSFSVKANAINLEKRLQQAGFNTCIIQLYGSYKVQIGVFSDKTTADAMLKKVKEDGFNAFITYY
ncbi:MAG: SPOR domain-containing protein [Lachnospiraceae bacterium]|nr:SPOR domain-containing protein [Lachnospiraceae bacterium]